MTSTVNKSTRGYRSFHRRGGSPPATPNVPDADLPDPAVESVYLTPFRTDFRPLMANDEVTDCLDEGGNALGPEYWVRLPCMKGSVLEDPLGNTIPSNRRAYRELQVKLRLDQATMQQLQGLALPGRNRFILILRMMDGRFLLCPYQSGMVLLSPIWVYGRTATGAGYPVVFFGYGVDGLRQCRAGYFDGPAPIDQRFSMAFDWAAERIPLELLRLNKVIPD